ncbi:hypothetical protein NDU88_003929 [Pleurodeles waltl]|uniref:Uncharacterized protein n=1 Tax=Pleurodeles waltl TaxID=8319 RepID=A0AAV7M8J1_PLEWA|nr:hypothetical protein NDU88_003929 [Pleurodeles waltl]
MGVGPVRTLPTARIFRCALECFYPVHCSIFSARLGRDRPSTSSASPPGGALHALLLVHQCYFLIVDVGSASTPPADRALFRVLSACGHFYPMHCSVFFAKLVGGQPWGPAPCLVPHSPALLPRCRGWACAGIAGGPLTPSRPQRTQALYPMYCSVFSVLGLHRHRRRTAHSAAPPVHTGALSDALQRVLCPSGGRPPFNDLYDSPGGALRTSILVPQRCFLVVGAGPALTPPADRALRRAISAYGRFVRCTVAYFLPGRGETAFQRLLQVPWRPAPCLVPNSRMLLLRYVCRARTVTAGGLRSQRTRALYPMTCSVFSAKSGRVRPSRPQAQRPWFQWGPPRSGIRLLLGLLMRLCCALCLYASLVLFVLCVLCAPQLVGVLSCREVSLTLGPSPSRLTRSVLHSPARDAVEPLAVPGSLLGCF